MPKCDMTEGQVIAYIQGLCNGLNLHAWRVRVEAPPVAQLADDGKTGSCMPDERCMVCDITVARGRPRTDVEETCVHEVMHLAMREVVGAVNLTMDRLSPGEWRVVKEAFGRAEEQVVIRLTRWAIGEAQRGAG